jgi:hypothetical protein
LEYFQKSCENWKSKKALIGKWNVEKVFLGNFPGSFSISNAFLEGISWKFEILWKM